jgi:hypothetical protein
LSPSVVRVHVALDLLLSCAILEPGIVRFGEDEMADKREKTISYRRAEWLTNVPRGTTLESCLRDAHAKLKTVDERTIIRDNGQRIKSANKLSPRDGGFFLHIIADTPGEEASVVPKKGDVETVGSERFLPRLTRSSWTAMPFFTSTAITLASAALSFEMGLCGFSYTSFSRKPDSDSMRRDLIC